MGICMVFQYKRRDGRCVGLCFGVFRVRPVFPAVGVWWLIVSKKNPPGGGCSGIGCARRCSARRWVWLCKNPKNDIAQNHKASRGNCLENRIF